MTEALSRIYEAVGKSHVCESVSRDECGVIRLACPINELS